MSAHLDTVNSWDNMLQCQYLQTGASPITFELAPGQPTPTSAKDANSVGATINASGEGTMQIGLANGNLVAQWLGDPASRQTTSYASGATLTITFDAEANVTIAGGAETLTLKNLATGTLVVTNGTNGNYIQWWVGDSNGSGVASGTLGNQSSGIPSQTVQLTGSSPWQAWMGPYGQGSAQFSNIQEGGEISVGLELN